ncbi:unnamed protein product [Paramecium pentaurelia]|uniref:Uncharacterized protein n=1 Tax=Paramecium pentaurelia TaxID=43138 RepID=A0A8S1T0W1_9CILI|nr:unnamed protein product [Paramecium pentaurelia]
MLSLQQPTSNVYHLVYLVIKRIFGCQQTNIEIQQQSLDSTLIQWVDRFSQVFQQQDEQGSQIYIIKALSLICKEMNNQKKYIRKAILPQITSFFEGLTNSIQYLEEIKFLDENFEQVLNQEVQLFYTLQILTETLNQLMCNNIIYSSLLKILSLPIQNINIDHFILQDNPTVIQSVLKFFKQQLSCKQTQQNVKQLLLKYLQQQVEMVGQYIIIAQYSSDLFDQNEYMVIIDNILKKQCNNQNQAFQLQKLVALTNLYILTKGQVDRFRKIFQLNVQLLNSQLNIVNFLNLGKLCAHASKNNTLDEQVFKCIVDQSDIQFPYQSDIQFPSIEQNTAHILFDSILQMLKLCKTLQFPILQNIYQYWTKYPNDSKVAQIFYEVLDILASVDPKSVQQTFSVNDEIIWLKVNSIIAKYQPQLLIKFIPQIANLLLDFHEYTQQGIMLLKKLLQYNTIDQVTMKVVFQILEIQLNTYEEQQLEAYTENVHDLLLVVWNIYMNRQITIQLLNNIISKIMHTQISATVNGLTTILCAIYLQNQNQFLQWLQSNSENTQQLFSRWLCFASILESKSLLQLQINAIYQFTQLPFLDQMHYVDPFVKYVIPLKAKMMEFLIQKQYQCVRILLKLVNNQLNINRI